MTILQALLMAGQTFGEARVQRRAVLKVGAATGLTAALPACGSENGTMDVSPAASSGPDSTSSAAETSSGANTTTAAASSNTSSTTTAATSTNTQTSTQPSSTGTTSRDSDSSTSTSSDTSDATSSDATSSDATSSDGSDSSSGETTSGTNGELEAPPWDDVPVCTASRTDGAGQGPFFIHNEEKEDDIDLFRQDIRGRYNEDAEEGTLMHLHLRILEAGDDCAQTPVPDVEVYIWHTDGQGYYSGFGNPGDQKPDDPYAGVPGQNDLDNSDRFCRGALISDANGVVSFKSIFPGWYNGRDVHIHLVVLKKDSASRGRMMYSGGDHVFTTQMYFDKDLTDSVHKASEPYLRRTKLSKYEDAITPDENGNSGMHFKATFEGGLVVAQMQVLVNSGN